MPSAAYLRRAAAGFWRRSAAAVNGAVPGALPARLFRRPLAVRLAAGAAGLSLVLLAWALVAAGGRHDGTVVVDLPQQPADRGHPAVAGAPARAPTEPGTLAETRTDSTNTLSVPSATAAAFAAIPLAPRDAALVPAPDPGLSERSDAGVLPRRGDDGRVAWQVYGRPFTAPADFPLVAVIVTGLGSSPIATAEIVRRLPGAFTLAFEPRAADAEAMARDARGAGHEILLGLPIQDDAFPFADRGPDALSPGLPAEENRARLERLLVRLAGYTGVFTDARGSGEGAGFGSASADPVVLASGSAAARGLLFVGGRPGGGVTARSAEGLSAPWVRPALTIGANLGGDAVDEQLAELEHVAETDGYAVALASPTPVAAARLALWAGTLEEKNIALAPVSAIARALKGQ